MPDDMEFKDFEEDGKSDGGGNEVSQHVLTPEQQIEAIYDVPVQISVVLGRTKMKVNDLMKLGRGAVVPLDRKPGDAIDIFINDRLVARGELAIIDDRLGVTMTEIIKITS
ncbi:MAG: flagellar motor switch protein FliN [Pseudomonadota bacterium]